MKIKGVSDRPQTPEDVINVLNSGTTLRFCSAVAALTDGAVLTGDASIRTRPNGPLLSTLSDLGATAFSIRNNGKAPLVVKGKMRGGTAHLNGGVSSQFLSALLIAAPLAEEDTKIVIEGDLKSRPYAEITLDMLADAGVRVEAERQEFIVPGGQSYGLKGYTIPGDFSSASYPLAAAAVTGSEVTVKGILPSRQGDSAIIDILNRMGAKVSWDREKGDLKIKGGELEGVEVDASRTPDLVPTIAVLGAVAGQDDCRQRRARAPQGNGPAACHGRGARQDGSRHPGEAGRAGDHGRQAARGKGARLPRPQDRHGPDGGRICGRRDEDRYG